MELPIHGEVVLETARLRLRRYQASDLAPFVRMNADPEVMRFVGGPWSEERSQEVIAFIEARWGEAGRGMLPIERKADGAFLGIAGPTWLDWFPEDVEVGWRLLPPFWGQGYATEAGRAWVEWTFARHGRDRVISVADLDNLRSRAVMERLGMQLLRVAEVEEKGERLAVAVHSVTRDEWEARGG